jgi:hypothetical protein
MGMHLIDQFSAAMCDFHTISHRCNVPMMTEIKIPISALALLIPRSTCSR